MFTCNIWVPACSTMKTRATQIVPKTTTVSFIKISAPLRVKGVFIKGLTKSSSTTAAMELRPVDNELKESYFKLILTLSSLLFLPFPLPFPSLLLSLPPSLSPSFFCHSFIFSTTPFFLSFLSFFLVLCVWYYTDIIFFFLAKKILFNIQGEF